ncbi:hypothetical protein DIPPA_14644 [Diplonema papillatum]|nr:hypothetical protein DIPPA_14644 [Diplonema papillatum]
MARLKKSKKKLKRSNGSRALRCCAPEVRGEVTDPQEAAANWALWDFEVPFQPFDGASLNEPPLSFFSRV